MEKFLLLVRQDLTMLRRITEDQHHELIGEMQRWVESLGESNNYLGGEPLTNAGKYVTRDQVLSDGPFIEAKEAISGYILISAENLDQAASIAQTCPVVMRNEMVLEVRPILEMRNMKVDG